MTTPSEPTFVRTAERQAFGVGGSAFHLIARQEHTGGKFALYETVAPPGGGSAAHVHSRESNPS